MNTILIAILVALGTGLGGYLYGVDVGEDKEVAKQAALEVVAEKAAGLVADRLGESVGKLRAQRSTIVQKATHEIQTNTVYADCKHTPSMLDTINESLTGKRADAAPEGIVPNPDAPAKSGFWSNNAKALGLGLHVPGMPAVNRN